MNKWYYLECPSCQHINAIPAIAQYVPQCAICAHTLRGAKLLDMSRSAITIVPVDAAPPGAPPSDALQRYAAYMRDCYGENE